MKYGYDPDQYKNGNPCYTVSKVYEGILGGAVEVASFEAEVDAAEYCDWKNNLT